MSAGNVPLGRWMKVQGMFKRPAHPVVGLIIVHVGVSQRCRAIDKESSAPLPTMSTRNVPAGRWMKVQGEFKMQANIASGVVIDIAAFKVSHSVDIDASALPVARARSVSIGAMDESSAFKVSHSAGCDIDPTALPAARGEVKLHRGDGGSVIEGSECKHSQLHSTKLHSTPCQPD
eukprot:scaffold49583_cov71-Phaeocystis_antarctica.AAC.3